MRLNYYNEISVFFNTLLVKLKICIALILGACLRNTSWEYECGIGALQNIVSMDQTNFLLHVTHTKISTLYRKNTAFDEHKISRLGNITCFTYFLHSKVKQYEIKAFHDPNDSRVSNNLSAFSITLTAHATFSPSWEFETSRSEVCGLHGATVSVKEHRHN
jgi:hypothetical protein